MPTSQGGTSGSLNLAVGIAAQSAEIISASLLQFACKGGFGAPRAPILHSQVTNLSKTSPPGLLQEGVSCFHCELQNLPLRLVRRSPSPAPRVHFQQTWQCSLHAAAVQALPSL